MRQVFRKIPVYTGDVSGVCSALFELGGMVVMHDPSGCNSTYNTHDEIRWYDHDSLIFLSGLNDTDAMLGNDEKLIRDIIEAARIYSPSFIAIANSPIPYIVGMDFDAITRIIEKETGIPSFYISTNGMHDYTRGAGLAFLQIAKRFAGALAEPENEKSGKSHHEKGEKSHYEKSSSNYSDEKNPAGSGKIRVNLLGMTPLDFSAPSTERSLHKKLASAGIEIVSNWAMDQIPVSAGRDSSSSIKTGGNPTEHRTEAEEPEDQTEAVELAHAPKGAPKGGAEPSADTPENGFGGQRNDRRYNHLLTDICRSASAHVNLLLSSTGLPTAEYMKERFGIPFVAGIPACGTEELYFEAVRTAAETGENQFPFRERNTVAADGADEKKLPVCLVGEPVVMTSLAASVQILTGVPTHVFGMTEEGRGEPAGSSLFLGGNDFAPAGEEELNARLRNIIGQSYACARHAAESETGVITDPCYEDAIPQGFTIIRLPHLAFSGRIFLGEIPDLVDESVVFLLQSFLSKSDRGNK